MDTIEKRLWKFQAGDLALDFANTVDWHASENPEELLNSYTDLVNWSFDYNLLSQADVHALHDQAGEHPEQAADTLSIALDLRETIYRIFSAIAHRGTPLEEDLESLRTALVQAISASRLVLKDEGFKWDWNYEPLNEEPLAFNQMLWPITQAAMDLLLSKKLSQVGQCADERGCGLLFIDTSRNHSRQWCSMETCGNRAKAQRFYQKNKSVLGVMGSAHRSDISSSRD
jgi:predicted RNA-binding Zn ribbon-like protein